MSSLKTNPLPTFQGDKSITGYRKLADKINDDFGYRTVTVTNADGGTTTLNTRGGFPEVITTRAGTTPIAARGLCVSTGIPNKDDKTIYCESAQGMFIAHKNPPTIKTPTGYSVATTKPAKFPAPPVAGKDYFDVLNIDVMGIGGGKLRHTTAVVRALPAGFAGLPLLFNAQEPHAFHINESIGHLAGSTDVISPVVSLKEGYFDRLFPANTGTLSQGVSIVPSGDGYRVSWYGEMKYMYRYGYNFDIQCIAAPPYITKLGETVDKWVSPSVYECDPTVDATVSTTSPSVTIPIGVPGSAPAFVLAKQYDVFDRALTSPPDDPIYGDNVYGLWITRLDVLPVISAPVIALGGSASEQVWSGGKSGTSRQGQPCIGGVVHEIVSAWTTQFNYRVKNQVGVMCSAISQGSLPSQIGRVPDLTPIPYSDGTKGRGPMVAEGDSREIEAESTLSYVVTAGGIPLVSAVGGITGRRDYFSGWVSAGAPGHESNWATRIAASSASAVSSGIYKLDNHMGFATDYGPMVEYWRWEVLGIDGDGFDRTIRNAVTHDEMTRTKNMEASARDYIYHDPKNDVSIFIQLSGSASIDAGTCSIELIVEAKGKVFKTLLGAATSSQGVTLGNEVLYIGNFYPGIEWFPVPEVPCVFSPRSEQGDVDYLAYTTAEEEAAGVVPQFVISLRLWLRNRSAMENMGIDEPTCPKPNPLSIIAENTYAVARCIGGGSDAMQQACYNFRHLRFSNEGVANFDDHLWPETTGLDKSITCWRI